MIELMQEIYCFQGMIRENIGSVLHMCNLLFVLAVPCTVILTYQPAPCKYNITLGVKK